MDFTREPIIETIITPKEGYKLVIRSSKSSGQEEYCVDAVEIVTFGQGLFFRSLERPKAFLVPISDYEVLEVREARMVLKNAGLDRSIKIGGGREGALKASREIEKEEVLAEEGTEQEEGQPANEVPAEARPEIRVDKKRDRRRNYRKRRGREEVKEEGVEPVAPSLEGEKISIAPPESVETISESTPPTPAILSSLLQPPSTLISETINRYRQNDLFKAAFYLTEEEQYKPHDKVQELLNEEDEDEEAPSLQEPAFDQEAAGEETSESTLSESEKEEENAEVSQVSEEALKDNEENQEEEFSFNFEREREFQPSLPLYSEEDVSMSTEESSTNEEGKPTKNHRHNTHNEEN